MKPGKRGLLLDQRGSDFALIENYLTGYIMFFTFQLRLDFVDFVINGPSTSTLSAAYIIDGNVVTEAGKKGSYATRCLDDIFSVSNPGGPSPPQICGNNVDAHSKIFYHDLSWTFFSHLSN